MNSCRDTDRNLTNACKEWDTGDGGSSAKRGREGKGPGKREGPTVIIHRRGQFAQEYLAPPL